MMTVATFIDFDEHLIRIRSLSRNDTRVARMPDVAGLVSNDTAAMSAEEMHANSGGAWPIWLNGPYGLAIALLIVSMYCFGLMDRVWITRRGLGKAWQYFWP